MAGSSEGEISRLEASSHASVCCNHQSKHPKCCDMVCKSDEANSEQLVKAQKMGVLERCPEDEVEGELIYYQHRLLNNAIARKHFAGICIALQSLVFFYFSAPPLARGCKILYFHVLY